MIPTWKETASSEQRRHDTIALWAWLLWVDGGCRNGHDLEDWLAAEKEYNAQ